MWYWNIYIEFLILSWVLLRVVIGEFVDRVALHWYEVKVGRNNRVLAVFLSLSLSLPSCLV